MSKLGDDDWACFLDHDAMFTTLDWYHQMESLIAEYPGAGCFTAMTNRVGNPAQIVGYELEASHLRRDKIQC